MSFCVLWSLAMLLIQDTFLKHYYDRSVSFQRLIIADYTHKKFLTHPTVLLQPTKKTCFTFFLLKTVLYSEHGDNIRMFLEIATF